MVDNIIYDISVVLVILSGASLLFYNFTISNNSVIFGIAGTIVFSFISILGLILLLNHRVKPFSWLIRKFGKNDKFPNSILNKKEKRLMRSSNIYEFYFQRRLAFFAIVIINFSAHLLSVTEVYLALTFLWNRSEFC